MKYKSLIAREANEIATRYRAIHDSFKNRGKDPETWREACQRFHTYESKLTHFLDRILSNRKIKDQQAMEFAISYLEVDPYYHRSGYTKEEILTRLKRSEFNTKQALRLRKVIIKVIEKGYSRELKYYHRLACSLVTPDFIEQLQQLAHQAKDKYLKRRAEKALYTIKHNTVEIRY